MRLSAPARAAVQLLADVDQHAQAERQVDAWRAVESSDRLEHAGVDAGPRIIFDDETMLPLEGRGASRSRAAAGARVNARGSLRCSSRSAIAAGRARAAGANRPWPDRSLAGLARALEARHARAGGGAYALPRSPAGQDALADDASC